MLGEVSNSRAAQKWESSVEGLPGRSRPFATLIGTSGRAQKMHMTGSNGVPNGHDLALLRSSH